MSVSRSNNRKKNKKISRINKSKKYKNIKQKKTHKNRNVFGRGILGVGNDGCVVDSISCGDYSKDNGYVAKLFYTNSSPINIKLNNRLKMLDPTNSRFNSYYFPSCDNYTFDVSFEDDLKNCQEQANKFDKQIQKVSTQLRNLPYGIPFQKKLKPINDTRKLSKSQWRYLRDSIELLRENRISHGDLPGNVMVDENDNPIIIDWEHAEIIDTNPSLLSQDKNAFDGRFTIKK